MSDEKQPGEPSPPTPEATPSGEGRLPSGMAQVGNQKVPRPDKVSDRSVSDDIDE